MPSDSVDIEGDLQSIRDFIWDDEAAEAYSDDQEGSPKGAEYGKTRDFIIGKDHLDDPSDYDYELGEVDIPSDPLDSLHALVNKQLSKYIGRLDSNKVSTTRYGEGTGDREYIKYITPESLPPLGEFEEIFSDTDLDSKKYENLNPDFQAIRIKGGEDLVIGFQHYWGNQLLGNTSLFNIWSRDDEITEIKEPIISVPQRLDAIYYDDVLYIFDDWRFEQIFDYYRTYEKRSQEVVDTLREGEVSFEDMNMVESAVTANPNMMRKLSDVQQNGVYEELSMNDVEWVIDQHPDELEGVEVIGEDEDREIQVGNKLDVWGLIHILNDDHVVSELADRVPELSDRVYRASNKEEIS